MTEEQEYALAREYAEGEMSSPVPDGEIEDLG